MGRPLAYDPEKALDTAMQVFWSRGYEATTLQDLLQAMGLSKSSFYQAFGGKKEIFLRSMARYREKIGQGLSQLLENSGSAREFIERMLLNSAAEARRPNETRRGCLIMNTATECAQKDGDIAGEVSSGFEGLRALLCRAVRRGQAEGGITQEVEAEALAGYLISSLGGIKMVVKGGADEERVREIVAVILRALD
ncbi:helix-turn-helix transcriptional regulator, TetR family [Geotalea daltonii FRC-32]|uniref:Helix-turn-helix transcriptional regulator, TetR family n=2 Tax=Geotalea TaxID=2910589 RepID=B9M3A8_GEODF|nr:helix-turn-helix transcriptional regulator, TetR family [Geotalea daltonii FRC-32]